MNIVFHFTAGAELSHQLAAQRARGLEIVIVPETDDAAERCRHAHRAAGV